MISIKPIVRAAAAATVVWAIGAGAAGAATSYEGSDFSYDFSSRRYMAACDQESDNTPVKGEYDFDLAGASNGDVRDSDGNNGICATKNTGGTVARHKTCEYRSLWPDACGNWQAT